MAPTYASIATCIYAPTLSTLLYNILYNIHTYVRMYVYHKYNSSAELY